MRRLVLLTLIVPALGACGGSHHTSSPIRPVSGPAIARDVPRWLHGENLPANARPGAQLFAVAGCTGCHTYDGAGSSNLGAPDLTAIGAQHLGVMQETAHLICPSCVNHGSSMPRYASLGRERLRQLAIFLEASKGGGTLKESLVSEITQDVPSWVKAESLPTEAVPGARLFARAGCTACHTYNGAGGSNLGAPDLTDIGSRNLGIQFQIKHLKCPSCVHSGSPMPMFGSLGRKRLRQLAIFLEASKGTR
jgi:mono/diheme cytochrome c family protein